MKWCKNFLDTAFSALVHGCPRLPQCLWKDKGMMLKSMPAGILWQEVVCWSMQVCDLYFNAVRGCACSMLVRYSCESLPDRIHNTSGVRREVERLLYIPIVAEGVRISIEVRCAGLSLEWPEQWCLEYFVLLELRIYFSGKLCVCNSRRRHREVQKWSITLAL